MASRIGQTLIFTPSRRGRVFVRADIGRVEHGQGGELGLEVDREVPLRRAAIADGVAEGGVRERASRKGRGRRLGIALVEPILPDRSVRLRFSTRKAKIGIGDRAPSLRVRREGFGRRRRRQQDEPSRQSSTRAARASATPYERPENALSCSKHCAGGKIDRGEETDRGEEHQERRTVRTQRRLRLWKEGRVQ